MADPESVERPRAPGHEPDLLATLRAGTIIEGKHRIDRIIGRGGMGVVAAATHVHLNERVALKFLQVRDAEVRGDFHARFALEARVCAKLRNEHIARVHDVGVWQSKVPFMVMEYLDGVDLRRLLRDDAKLPLAQAIEYVVQICDGLAEAHAQGIVHRDLKPPNIFLTKRADGTELVKVLDFGISKWTSPEEDVGELTKTGVMLGSPKYMSPEQLNGDTIDARADVWSIGAILYQMLTGHPPYDFPQVTQTFMAIASGAPPLLPTLLAPSIPPAIEALILRCLTRDKARRVQNVAELAGALLDAVDSPFAGQARGRIGAVLDTTGALSNRAGPLSSTTGSYATFSVGSTGASTLAEIAAARDPSQRPAATATPTRAQSRGKTWWAAGAGIASLAFVAFVGMPRASDSEAANGSSSARSRTFAAKQLTHDRATRLVAVTSDPPPRAPPYFATRSLARTAIASTTAPPPAPPPASPPVTPDAAPARAPAPTSAANPLDDRQ